MTGNKIAWRAPLAGLASLAMVATMGVTALGAGAEPVSDTPSGTHKVEYVKADGTKGEIETVTDGDSLGNALGSTLQPKVDAKGYESDDDAYKFVGWTYEDGSYVDFTAPVKGDLVIAPKYVPADEAVAVTFTGEYYGFFPVANTYSGNSRTFYAPVSSGLSKAQLPTDKAGDGIVVLDYKVSGAAAEADPVTDLTTVSWGDPKPADAEVVIEPNNLDKTAKTVSFTGKDGSYALNSKLDGGNDSVYKIDVTASSVAAPALVSKMGGTDTVTAYSKWVNDSNTTKTAAAGETVEVLDGVNYTAGVSTKYFLVKFDSKGGSKVAGQYVAEGGYVAKPADPTKDKSVFAGWAADSALKSPFYFQGDTANAKPVTAPVTVYAKWDTDASKTLKVTFKDSDKYEGAQKDVVVKAKSNEPLAADQVPAWTRDGYVLSGWSLLSDVSRLDYSKADLADTNVGDLNHKADNKNHDVELYAVWTKVSSDYAAVALKYIDLDKIADGSYEDAQYFTAESWNEFVPVYKQAKKAYETAKAQTVGEISAAKSGEIVNMLNEGWQKLQYKASNIDKENDKLAAVHRLYDPRTDEHFYTADGDEIKNLTSTTHTNGNWNDEGTLFYMGAVSRHASFVQAASDAVVSEGVKQAAADAAAKALAPFAISKTVTRLFNLANGDHVWTANAEETANLSGQANWTVEGTAFNVPAYNSVRDVVRLYQPAKSRHLLSADPAEQAKLAGSGWNLEGTAFKAF